MEKKKLWVATDGYHNIQFLYINPSNLHRDDDVWDSDTTEGVFELPVKLLPNQTWKDEPQLISLIKIKDKLPSNFDIQKKGQFNFFTNAEPNFVTISNALDIDLMATANVPKQTIKIKEIDTLELYDDKGNMITITANDVELFKKYFKSIKKEL